MILIELFPAWFVYSAFILGILTMMSMVGMILLLLYHLRVGDKKREAEEAMRYAEEMGPYPWGIPQSE